MSKPDSNERDGCAMAAERDPAREVRQAIDRMFRRSWRGPQNAYLQYLDGVEVKRAVYASFSLDIVGRDAATLAIGALQHHLAQSNSYGDEVDLLRTAVVWRTTPEITDGKLWFRLAIIPAHIVQVLLQEAD